MRTYLVEDLGAAPAPPRSGVEVVRSVGLPLVQERVAKVHVDVIDLLTRVHFAWRRLDGKREHHVCLRVECEHVN